MAKTREQKLADAYEQGKRDGAAGKDSQSHPWAGNQTNFNKPLRREWYRGWRQGRFEAGKLGRLSMPVQDASCICRVGFGMNLSCPIHKPHGI